MNNNLEPKATTFSFEQQQAAKLENPAASLAVGDYVRVGYRVVEGTKERVQMFEGTVIAIHGGAKSVRFNFTVRRGELWLCCRAGVFRLFAKISQC